LGGKVGGGPELDGVLEEISDGVLLLIYDLPTEEPVKTLMRNNHLSPRERGEAEFLAQRMRAWYKWAVSRLRWLGYPLQLSVVQLSKSSLPTAKRTIDYVLRRFELATRYDRWGLYRDRRPDIKIIRLKPEREEDAKTLLDVARETLKGILLDLREDILRRLREEKQDPVDVYTRTKNVLRKVREMDGYRLLERDEELRGILASIEMLLA